MKTFTLDDAIDLECTAQILKQIAEFEEFGNDLHNGDAATRLKIVFLDKDNEVLHEHDWDAVENRETPTPFGHEFWQKFCHLIWRTIAKEKKYQLRGLAKWAAQKPKTRK